MALEPLHQDDEEQRRLAGLPPMPTQPVPRIMAPVAVPAPVPYERPAPVAAEPSAADFVRRRLAAQQAPAGDAAPQQRLPSQSWGALLAGIASARAGRGPGNPATFMAMDQAQQERADRQRAEEDADPSSERSARARAAASPMLQRLGLGKDEIGSLSAADVGGLMKGGNLALQLAQARATAEAAKQKQAQEALEAQQRRAQEIEDRDEQRKYEETQAAGPKFDRSMQLARVQSGLGVDRARETAALSDEYAQAREARAEAARIEAEKRKNAQSSQAHNELRLRDYGKELTAHNVPTAETQLSRLNANIAKARARNGGEIFNRRDEIIRRGPIEGHGLMSTEGKRVMADLQALKNMKIKDTSGQAVTLSEMPRVAAGMGLGFFSGEGEIEAFVGNVAAELGELKAGISAGYEPEVVSAYESNREGFRARQGKGGKAGKPANIPKPRPGTITIRDPQTGNTGDYEGTAEEAEADGYEVLGG